MSSSKLKNKTIWITGAGSGIGRELALGLAACGARLGLTARSEGPLQSLCQEIVSLGGGAPLVLRADVTDADQLKGVYAEFQERFGSADVLIANAGMYDPGDLQGVHADEVLRVMDVNFGGMIRCIEQVLPDMKERKKGLIIGVSSLVAYRGLPGSASYCASKAAMTNYLECLRFNLQRTGVEVQIVSPGFVKTRLTDKNTFQMPFRISAKRAARYIIRGMERGSYEIHFPPAFSWPMKFLRILPYPLYHFLVSKKAVR